MNRVTIDTQLCKGCSICVASCPKKVMELNRDVINDKGYSPAMVTDEEKCIYCGICAIMCPDSAITVEKERK